MMQIKLYHVSKSAAMLYYRIPQYYYFTTATSQNIVRGSAVKSTFCT